MHTGMLPCLVPSWPQIVQIRISFRSRSDLVLDADHALDFVILSRFTGVYLILHCFRQSLVGISAPIKSIFSPETSTKKSGASLFLPCSHKNVVAHMQTKNMRCRSNLHSLQHVSHKAKRQLCAEEICLDSSDPYSRNFPRSYRESHFSRTYPSGPDPLRTPPPDLIWTRF